MSRVPPPDDIAHQDGVLMAEVTTVNEMLGRYVLAFLDADAGRAAELPPAEETALAERVAAVAAELHARATRRAQHGDPPPLIHGTNDLELTECPKAGHAWGARP